MTWGKGLPTGLATAVLDCIAEVKQRPINPARTGTDAKTILALWRANGKPEPEAFRAELLTVIRWARESPDKLAARDIRAEGWDGGTDRHADLSTLCRQDKWSARVDAARAWGQTTAAAGEEDWIEADACRALAAKCIESGADIDPPDRRMWLLTRRTLRVIGGRPAWRGKTSTPAWVEAWRTEWPNSIAALNAKQEIV